MRALVTGIGWVAPGGFGRGRTGLRPAWGPGVLPEIPRALVFPEPTSRFGRYVGAEAVEDDGKPFEEKRKRLTATPREQQPEAAKLGAAIEVNLRELGSWTRP